MQRTRGHMASGSMMSPERWGSHAWAMLHAVSFGLPEDCILSESHQRSFCTFLRALSDLLPCEQCRAHFQEEIRARPPEERCSHANEARLYLWELHNRVNERLGKPRYDWDALCEAHATPEYGVCGRPAAGPPPSQQCAPPKNTALVQGGMLYSNRRVAVAAAAASMLSVTVLCAVLVLCRFGRASRR